MHGSKRDRLWSIYSSSFVRLAHPAIPPERGEHVAIELALEGDDELGQALRLDPFPGIELGMRGGEVDLGIPAGEAHREPFLALAAIAAAPHLAAQLFRQVVEEP